MKLFFSADYHLDHANIIRYSNRPVIRDGDVDEIVDDWISDDVKRQRNDEMNQLLINNHNCRLTEDDVLYHVGDFCFKGDNRSTIWEKLLNGTIVHIKGNHDNNNGVKTYITHAIMEFGGKVVYVVHRPPEQEQMETLESHIVASCDFIICGHVHDAWKHKKIIAWSNGCRSEKIAINVGVDVWNYEPVSIDSIIKYYHLANNGIVDEMGNRK